MQVRRKLHLLTLPPIQKVIEKGTTTNQFIPLFKQGKSLGQSEGCLPRMTFTLQDEMKVN